MPAGPLRWLMRAMALVALGLSGYLAYTSPPGAPPPAGCGPGTGCGEVLSSPWSQWLGIPVVFPAMLVYGAMLLLLFGIEPEVPRRRQRWAWLGLAVLAMLAGGAALWFVVIQAVLVEAFCIYCMLIHAMGLMLSALILIFVPVAKPLPPTPEVPTAASTAPPAEGEPIGDSGTGSADAESDPHHVGGGAGQSPATALRPIEPGPTPREMGRLAALAIVLLSVMIGGQWLFKPPTHRVLPYDLGAGQQWEIPFHEFPRLGELDAQVALLFFTDYTCPHCRDLHHGLQAARERYGDQVAIAVLPAPLSEQCNREYGSASSVFEGGCAYARLALATWLAHPEAFEEVDACLAEGRQPPSLEEAERFATDRIGQSRLRAAMQSERVEAMLQHGINLNGAIRRHQREMGEAVTDGVPTLLLGDRGVLIGTPAGGAEGLFEILERELGIEPAQPR